MDTKNELVQRWLGFHSMTQQNQGLEHKERRRGKRERRQRVEDNAPAEQVKLLLLVLLRNTWLVFLTVKVDLREFIGATLMQKLLEKAETQEERETLEQGITVSLVDEATIHQDVWLVGIGNYGLV
jgi:hypothetical protein